MLRADGLLSSRPAAAPGGGALGGRPYSLLQDRTTTGGTCWVAWFHDAPDHRVQGDTRDEALATLGAVTTHLAALAPLG